PSVSPHLRSRPHRCHLFRLLFLDFSCTAPPPTQTSSLSLHDALPISNGRPHLMPLWYVVDDGVVTAWTYAKSQKVRNLERKPQRSEEHTSELQSHLNLVCRLLLEKKK